MNWEYCFWPGADIDSDKKERANLRGMRRGLATVIAPLILSLPACGDRWIDEALLVDLPGQDQCFFVWLERPDDCFERPPCMYADAVLYLRPTGDAGSFSLSASSGGGVWMEGVPRRGDPRLPEVLAESTSAAAAQLPEILRALDVPARPISQTCVGVFVDQDLRFGDVVSFHRELTTLGVHRVELDYARADDPMRMIKIRLEASSDRAAFIETLRNYANSNGFDLSHEDLREIDHGDRFEITGAGLTISAHNAEAEPFETSRTGPERDPTQWIAFFDLTRGPDGREPTEEMMDDTVQRFASAVTQVEGANLSVELTSRQRP